MEQLRIPGIRVPFQAPRGLIQAMVALIWVAVVAGLGWFAGMRWAEWSAGRAALGAAGVLLLGILPGLALVQIFWRDLALDTTERITAAWGLGVALPPLLLELAHLVGLPWGRLTTLAYLTGSIAILAWPVVRRLRTQDTRALPQITAPTWHTFFLLGLIVMALLARLYTARDLIVSPNVDSYHHTLIAQLLVENGGIFSSWEPYAPLRTFTYHYGFHANVAFVHWLTGLPVVDALPIVGQALSAATVTSAYALTRRLTGSPSAGLWAALMVGFVNIQPAYYVFWGRYPLVTSHVVLIGLLLSWMYALERSRLNWRILILAAITTAALMLTHYQTTIFAALFLFAYLVALLLRTATWRAIVPIVVRSALISGIGLVLAAPWLINVFNGYLARNVAYVTRPEVATTTIIGTSLPATAPMYLKAPIIALAVLGLLLALRQPNWRVGLLVAWVLITVAAAMPHTLGLPGTGVIEPEVAFLALYLSAIPLAAYLPGAAQEWLAGRWPQAVGLLAGAALLLTSAWGISWQRDLLPDYARMVTSADTRAYAWVRTNTPPDTRFLVNSAPLYNGGMIVGTDGGWWLPLLAGRQVNVPPMTYGSELNSDPIYVRKIHGLAVSLRRRPLTDNQARSIDLTRPEALQALQTAGITYVYSGARPLQGPGTFARTDRIDTSKLRTNANFRLVYDHDGVEIFQIVQATGQ